jgi:predicted nucleic acid-binding protein
MALVREEPAGPRVRDAIAKGRTGMSSVNLGEAYYLLCRRYGRDAARGRVARLRQVVTVEDPDWDVVEAAADLKANGGLSYADAFCIATAKRHQAALLTGDPEIVAAGAGVEIVDLRRDGS